MKVMISVVLLVFILHSSIGQTRPQCKPEGQYCQYHFECCSNNCLTFSYKCIKSRVPNQNDAQLSQTNEMHPNLQAQDISSVQELISRFGSIDKVQTQEPSHSTTIPQSSAPPTQGYTSEDGGCYSNGRSCSYSGQCCSGQCSHITNMCIIPSPNVGPPPPQSPSCLVIGQKCYLANECCPPLRCHGYYHHCVT